MSKLFSVFSSVILFATMSAHAAEYDYYSIRCTITGTTESQVYSSTKLLKELTLDVSFITEPGHSGSITTLSGIRSVTNNPDKFSMNTNAVGQTIWHPLCDSHEVSADLGELVTDQLEQILTAMGALNFPKLGDAIPSGKLALGTIRTGTACRTFGGDDTNEQIKLPPARASLHIQFLDQKYYGRIYHLSIGACRSYYVEPDGPQHRVGN